MKQYEVIFHVEVGGIRTVTAPSNEIAMEMVREMLDGDETEVINDSKIVSRDCLVVGTK